MDSLAVDIVKYLARTANDAVHTRGTSLTSSFNENSGKEFVVARTPYFARDCGPHLCITMHDQQACTDSHNLAGQHGCHPLNRISAQLIEINTGIAHTLAYFST